MKTAIKIENVSKRYRIGGLHPGYMTFREMIGGILTAPFRKLRKGNGHQTLWALSNVNLEIRQGELVGIIGHNGAGKSTLLKILSRVTKPTTGDVILRGRIGSLLEVGTGFHPDLTGRENIFLAGAILGMRRAEIERKFDEIVAFSELEKFVETPVKWYSSGMYVRLAFSVAAHLEPEILMMDEVLAVGDAAFQQKCLDKMHDIRNQGRTILFVSHDMAAITRLCKRVVLLEKGQIVFDGEPRDVVKRYLSSSLKTGAIRDWENQDAPGDSVVRLRRARVRAEDGATVSVVEVHKPFGVELTYEVLEDDHTLVPVIEFYNEQGTELFSTHDTSADWRRRTRPRGTYKSTVWIPGNLLAEGSMIGHISIMSHFPSTSLHAHEPNAIAFQVVDSPAGDSARGDYVGPMPGVVRPLLTWTTEQNKDSVEVVLGS
ncbi:MAG TPA: ABC transporter ATP-binding protein [Pyrinomonadaceae bacterium]|jgi:lipopolysaccharide transport system ATP-binding protein|nr:ABC transporter ATP-binding protein [Pyrinomonadaceae bacterium]